MDVYRTKATLQEDGTLALQALPFHKGETVEVLVRKPSSKEEQPSPQLQGSVLHYENPTDPVSLKEWEALG